MFLDLERKYCAFPFFFFFFPEYPIEKKEYKRKKILYLKTVLVDEKVVMSLCRSITR
jgi:hypothetical protein